MDTLEVERGRERTKSEQSSKTKKVTIADE